MKYIISTPTEKESKRVQDILFAAGKGWIVGGAKYSFTDIPFLVVNKGVIQYANNIEHIEELIKEGAKAVDARNVEKTFPPPEKMIDIDVIISTIRAALLERLEEK